MRAQDLISQNISYSNNLNEKIWDGSKLRPEVRYKLLQISKMFMESLQVPNFKLLDILLRGSLANYNYTKYSDIDLHLVTDYSALDCDIAAEFYRAKKTIWNEEHDITVYGYEIETYVEDADEANVSEGTFSVLDNKWIRKPSYNPPNIDSSAVLIKSRNLMQEIDQELAQGDVQGIERLFDKIKQMRKSGLEAGGEFSTENLVFKVLRNQEYIKKLYDAKIAQQDKDLSFGDDRAVN